MNVWNELRLKSCFCNENKGVKKNGKTPVMLRVTVNGKREVTSVNLKVAAENWNPTAEKSFGRSPKDEELNLGIDTIRV